jgi:hypothetical protein
MALLWVSDNVNAILKGKRQLHVHTKNQIVSRVQNFSRWWYNGCLDILTSSAAQSDALLKGSYKPKRFQSRHFKLGSSQLCSNVKSFLPSLTSSLHTQKKEYSPMESLYEKCILDQ